MTGEAMVSVYVVWHSAAQHSTQHVDAVCIVSLRNAPTCRVSLI